VYSRKLAAILRRLFRTRAYHSHHRRRANSISCVGLPQHYELTVDDEPEVAALQALAQALELEDFNESQWPGHAPWRPFGVFIREAETIVAGLSGETYCGWLVIKYLWVRDDLRRRGFGRELMAQAEACAVERGCHSVWLDTFSFQALGFYQKLGYEQFGALDYPPVHKRYFMKKLLATGR
jgi:GNAT superfamily N-acetyltransferase